MTRGHSVALPVLLLACGGGAAAPATPHAAETATMPVTLGTSSDVRGHLVDALKGGGHVCRQTPSNNASAAIVCDQDQTGRFTFVVVYAETPRRVVFVIPSKMKVPCDQAAVRFNELNYQYDSVTLSCEKEHFTAATTLYVPDAGLSSGDVNHHVEFFEATLITLIRANNLTELIE